MVTFGPLSADQFSATRLHSGEVVSSGFEPLDRLLPAGGVRRGSLLEWLGDGEASGAMAAACAVACRLSGSVAGAGATATPTIIVVDRQGRFYPPAVMGWLATVASSGGKEPQLVVARASSAADEAWAIDQALRCRGVAAVLACPQSIQPTTMRRWQLAARGSQAVGLFVRTQEAGGRQSSRRQPTWAEARIAVSPLSGESLAVRRLRLTLVGGPWAGEASVEGRAVEIGIDLSRGCCLSRGGQPRGQESGGIRMFRPQAAPAAEAVACRAS
jgi:hypothetical protein